MNQLTSSPVLQFDHMTIRYSKVTAATDVSLAVDRGTVYALLGRNGAGKSSLVRCLLGQQKSTSGCSRIFGEDVWKARARVMERIGVVPEEPDTPIEMNARQAIAFCESLYPSWDGIVALGCLKRFGVPLATPSGRLSKGQKRQLALALALAPQPELLILDDPTLGLDVVARKSFYEELIGELADRGTTVFLTSHDLDHVERIANRVGILHQGTLLLDDDLEAIKRRFKRIRFCLQGNLPLAPVDGLEGMQILKLSTAEWGCEVVVSFFDDRTFAQFCALPEVVDATAQTMSLEEIFISLTETGKGDGL